MYFNYDMNISQENSNCIYKTTCNHVDCAGFCLKWFKSQYYLTQSLIPEDKWVKYPLRVDNDGADIDAFEQLSAIEADIENKVSTGFNLYIFSPYVGNGKTSWAYRMALSYVDKTWYKRDLKPTVLFISVPKFLLDLKANISEKSAYIEHIMHNVTDVDLVIWDDIGSKNGTEFEVSHLLSIIDQRVARGLSNIYTSNMDREELHQVLGDRLYSRIVNYSDVIRIVGKDKRGI